MLTFDLNYKYWDVFYNNDSIGIELDFGPIGFRWYRVGYKICTTKPKYFYLLRGE